MTKLYVEITPRLRLTADSCQFILQELRRYKSGKEEWVSIGFYRDLDFALQEILRRKIRMRGRTTLTQLCALHGTLREDISRIIEEAVIQFKGRA